MALAFLLIELLVKNPVSSFSVVFAVILSVVLHELGHGIVAIWQGDETPRITGHMTWNPMVHMGGFSLVLLFVVGIAFGAMPVYPPNFRSRYGRALVSFAGPAVNLVLALVALTALALWLRTGGPAEAGIALILQNFLFILGYLNIVLCVFNLLPVPPLDGATVLADFHPGYRRLISNPDNQPFFMGGFILVFIFADKIFDAAESLAVGYLHLFHA